MKITYIFHSGFLIETEKSYYVFDYYKGSLPQLDTSRPVVVFSSHNHGDHYNAEVFDMLRNMGMKNVLAVLSKDIPQSKYPSGIEVIKVHGQHEYSLPGGEKLETLISTDEGVAFLLTTDEGTLYHAGDLNDWTWEGESVDYNKQMRGSYRSYINTLSGKSIDVAFIPLDPRQEQHYAAGITYFLSVVTPKEVYPMHYWEQPEIISTFLKDYPQYKTIIKNTENYFGGTL